MTWKPLRQLIRDFFGPSPEQLYRDNLKEQLAKCERDKDYFRTRAERLELRLIPEVQPRAIRPPVNAQAVERKTWAQVQQENAERIRKEAEEKQAKPREGLFPRN